MVITIESLLTRTIRNGDCMEFTGCKSPYGYGQLSFKGSARQAHRVAYELAFGEIPGGLCVLHRCDNRACINPAHLFLGTQLDNIADMIDKGRGGGPPQKNVCKLGHPLSGDNLMLRGNGEKRCRECTRASAQRFRNKLKQSK